MLSKKERLTKEEFDRSFSLGKRTHSPHMQLIMHPSSEFHGAVVVGKKVKKKAVDRNTLRRRLYGVLYRYMKDSAPDKTIIVIAKPPLAQLGPKEQRSVLQELLMRL